MFLASAYSSSPPASAISCSTVMSLPSGYAPGLVTCPVMKTLRLLISLTTTVTFGSSDELRAAFAIASAQLLGRQPRRLDVVQQRQRDLAVRPHDDVGRHVLLAPEHDRQHVLRADHVVRSAAATPARTRRARLRRGGACCAPAGAATVAAHERQPADECRANVSSSLPFRFSLCRRPRLGKSRASAAPAHAVRYCRYSLNGSWQSCLRRKFRNRL